MPLKICEADFVVEGAEGSPARAVGNLVEDVEGDPGAAASAVAAEDDHRTRQARYTLAVRRDQPRGVGHGEFVQVVPGMDGRGEVLVRDGRNDQGVALGLEAAGPVLVRNRAGGYTLEADERRGRWGAVGLVVAVDWDGVEIVGVRRGSRLGRGERRALVFRLHLAPVQEGSSRRL